MTIVTSRYIRKPLHVDAVQITAENFVDIAKWCQGEIRANDTDEIVADETAIDPSTSYVRVRVHNPKNARQTKGFVGDWILYTERGYKVYTQKAFKGAFDLVPENGRVEQDVQVARRSEVEGV